MVRIDFMAVLFNFKGLEVEFFVCLKEENGILVGIDDLLYVMNWVSVVIYIV